MKIAPRIGYRWICWWATMACRKPCAWRSKDCGWRKQSALFAHRMSLVGSIRRERGETGMNRNILLSVVAGGALILSAGTARAQGPHRGGPGFGGPMELMGFEGGPGGKVVTGAPFSATATFDTTETLSDGTVIHRTGALT